MLAKDKPSFPIQQQPIAARLFALGRFCTGISARGQIYFRAPFFRPFVDPIGGHIWKQQHLLAFHPQWALGPFKTFENDFYPGSGIQNGIQGGVNALNTAGGFIPWGFVTIASHRKGQSNK